jgi:hypothetical protein
VLDIQHHKHRHNLKKGLLGKSKLAQHACEDHWVGWDKDGILEIENNSRYRKCKESGHMVCLTSLISLLPYGSSLSAMKLATYREGQDMGIYIIFVPEMVLEVGMYYNNMETFKLLHCIGAYGFGCWMV